MATGIALDRGQVRRLAAGGSAGPRSFEPFPEDMHRSADIEADLRASMAWLDKD